MASQSSSNPDKSPPEAEGWETLRRFLPYLWPKDNPPLRRRIVIAMAFVLLAKTVTLALPFAYSQAVDAMSDSGAVEEGALVAFALVAAYGLGRFTGVLFDNLRNMAFERVEQNATLSLSEDVFHRLHRLPTRNARHSWRRSHGRRLSPKRRQRPRPTLGLVPARR
ncbi:MAG: hypothetical protein AAFR88_08880, partial [Pseudomonadota bacterium]